ncbi:MAG: GNAT family N-acetyltransferase [Muribaculum sp.]|nr:GNAT family N-acetyltransferase [Muribaculum sp.]
MNLSITHSFSSIETDWKNLYSQTPEVSPFLHPEAFKIAYKYFYPYYLINRHRPILCTVKEGNNIVAIIPLLKGRDGIYRLLGAFNGFNECGFIYDKTICISNVIEILKVKFDNIEFQKIDERSPLSSFADDNCSITNNVAIVFKNGYESWFKSLSSSIRQNIRTAYNRLNKDDKNLSVKTFIGGGKYLPINDLMDLYCFRHEQRYGVKTSWLKKWFLKHQNFATLFYRYAPNALTFTVYIDGHIAGFLSGLYNEDRLIVPRLSIDDSFRRYSPGVLLIAETIKYLEQHATMRILDLSMGEESYKFQLGGIVHKSYRFKL